MKEIAHTKHRLIFICAQRVPITLNCLIDNYKYNKKFNWPFCKVCTPWGGGAHLSYYEFFFMSWKKSLRNFFKFANEVSWFIYWRGILGKDDIGLQGSKGKKQQTHPNAAREAQHAGDEHPRAKEVDKKMEKCSWEFNS